MFANTIEVLNFSDHLYVKFFFSVGKSWFEYDKEIVSVFIFEWNSLCERRHFSRSEINPGLNLSSSITEREHIRIIFPPKAF